MDLILEQLLQNLEERDFHLDTGVVGTKYMLRVLTDYGHADVMYKIAQLPQNLKNLPQNPLNNAL